MKMSRAMRPGDFQVLSPGAKGKNFPRQGPLPVFGDLERDEPAQRIGVVGVEICFLPPESGGHEGRILVKQILDAELELQIIEQGITETIPGVIGQGQVNRGPGIDRCFRVCPVVGITVHIIDENICGKPIMIPTDSAPQF